MSTKPTIFALAVLSLGLAPATFSDAQTARPRLRVAVSTATPHNTPLWVAKDKKIFEKHGLDVQLIFVGGGALVAQMLAAGEIDVAANAPAALANQIAGKRKEWDARITEQIPDKRIAWQSEGGEFVSGAVSFEPVGFNRTRVTLAIHYQPEGPLEKVGDAVGIVSAQVERDLERFKEFIESRGQETGAWRGVIQQ